MDPVLFVFYINDLEFSVNSNLILYTDDTTAILQGNSILELENVTKITLEQLTDWFNANRLKSN